MYKHWFNLCSFLMFQKPQSLASGVSGLWFRSCEEFTTQWTIRFWTALQCCNFVLMIEREGWWFFADKAVWFSLLSHVAVDRFWLKVLRGQWQPVPHVARCVACFATIVAWEHKNVLQRPKFWVQTLVDTIRGCYRCVGLLLFKSKMCGCLCSSHLAMQKSVYMLVLCKQNAGSFDLANCLCTSRRMYTSSCQMVFYNPQHLDSTFCSFDCTYFVQGLLSINMYSNQPDTMC